MYQELTVENRYYPRIRLSMNVDLFRRGQPIGSAVTKDLSLGGLSLKLDKPALVPNDIVLIKVWMHGALQTLQGFVVYSDSQQSGVMLIGMSREATRAYFNFLRDMDIPLRMVLDKPVAN
ncbi:MAG: PilZ domain-containing protein [Candidatus Thiodiazotropha taylori]|nr:PilZ domain-containing protein [Candidatus Thiodiazotropha taylori]MCG7893725.1 PilZ domain-containing protein [Candidatus Thiodiazotropha taylori]MCG7973884.1 PilZ domain-containing protein [Candidatus Thiodiazotropha taylori]MCG8068054.1 PilZ domain-containing protein [Candidatus Thiodiazotropha taylori]